MRKGGKSAGTEKKCGKNGSLDFIQNVLIMLEIVIDVPADESGSGKFFAVGGDDDEGRISGNGIFF